MQGIGEERIYPDVSGAGVAGSGSGARRCPELRGKAAADTDGREGRKSLALILGIYESARTGKNVTIASS